MTDLSTRLANLEADSENLRAAIIEIVRSLPPQYLYGGSHARTDILNALIGASDEEPV